MRMRIIAYRRDAEADVLDADEGLESGREIFDFDGLALCRNDFQAVVVGEMDMLCGDYEFLKVVLDVEHFADELALVVVVVHDDHAGDDTAFLPLLLHKLAADQVSDRLGSVLVVLLLDMLVESVYQRLFK